MSVRTKKRKRVCRLKEREQWFCDQVERHKVALYRLARSIVHRDEDAEDAVAEAVCKAYANLDGLRQPERCKAWLLRIAANEAYSIVKNRSRLASREGYGPALAARPEPRPEEGLWPLVQALPDSQRAVVALFYYDGFSVRETAAVLGLTEGAVKTRLNRGRQALKQMLENEEAV